MPSWEDIKENVPGADQQALLRVVSPLFEVSLFFSPQQFLSKKNFFFSLTIDLVRVASTFSPHTVALL